MGTELASIGSNEGLKSLLYDGDIIRKYRQEVAKLKNEASKLRDLLGVDLEKLPELLNDKKLIDILTTQTTIELFMLTDEVTKLNSEKCELNSEKDKLKTEIIDLQEERQQAAKTTDSLNQEIIKLKANLTELEETKNNLESNVEERKKVLEQEFNELKTELEVKKKTLELNINEQLETKKSLEQDITKLEANLEEHRKNLESIASKQLEREKLLENANKIKKELKDREEKKLESDRKMKEIEEKLKNKNIKVKELENQLTGIESKKNVLEVNKKGLQEAYLKYGWFKDEKYRGTAQQLIPPLRQNIRDIECQLKEFVAIENELSEAKKEIEKLKEQKIHEDEFSVALKNDIREYKEKFNNAQEDLKKKDILIDELRKELQQEKNNREIVELSREKGNLEKLSSSTRVKVAERNLQGYLEMLNFEDERTKETAKNYLNRILNDIELDALLNGPKRIEEIDQKLSKSV
ncbi:15872_t:CDS:2 [Cetraspora pellucida]|uniref:15872_t:CDS:1 n=1 Tax=Cetraspora pellucida TaxID=1433469 RepID=A0A9N8Z5U4_9GLOM|nr:15872_t:CDS:2 [Cetraspora pellucida]